MTFHQNIKEFSIGIPVLVATFTGFPAPWRRRKIRKSQKKRRRPVGDGQKTKYQHSSYVDGRNHAACRIVEPLSMIFCMSTSQQVAGFLPSTL